jgi:hypothetical protein
MSPLWNLGSMLSPLTTKTQSALRLMPEPAVFSFLRIFYAEKLRQADLQCSADRMDQVDVGP